MEEIKGIIRTVESKLTLLIALEQVQAPCFSCVSHFGSRPEIQEKV
jgi:hypothetical protein